MKRHLILLFALLLGFSMAFGQDKSTKKGDKAFESGDYYQAVEEYSALVENAADAATRSYLRSTNSR